MSSPAGARSSTPDSNDDGQSQPPNVASRVFTIVELAETILNELPPRDLLLSQRTCKSFRDTFQGSIKIKKRLRLLPSTSKVLSLPPLWPDSHLLMWSDYGTKAWVAGKRDPDVIVLEVPCRDEAFLEWLAPDSSCRNMQIGSPPVRTGKVIGERFMREYDNWYGLELAGITCDRGLTLDDLVNVAGRVKKEFPEVCAIYFRLGVSEVDEEDPAAPKRRFVI